MATLLRFIFFLSLLLPVSFSYSQDVISSVPVFNWKVSSKKTSEKKYELTFTAIAVSGNRLYAPGQDLNGVPSAELSFNDSSISVESLSAGVNIITVPSAVFTKGKIQLISGSAEWKAIINFKNTAPAKLLGNLSAFYDRNEEFLSDPPFSFNVDLEGGVSTAGKIKIAFIDIRNPVNNCGDEGTRSKTILGIFLLGLLGGLIALITPCVFPMIPVTVTFFTKKSHNRRKALFNAFWYGFFIFLIYVAITLPFHLASKTISPEIFNNISTNVWLNLLFFAVFVIFALSFFGLYEIGLPSSIANKTDSRSGIGNLTGIFFMAGTLAIVSFSCTGPILGTLLANVANEGP